MHIKFPMYTTYMRALELYVFMLCVIIARVPRPLYKIEPGIMPGSYDAVGNTDMRAYYIMHEKDVHIHVHMYSVLVPQAKTLSVYEHAHVCTDNHHVCVVGIV